ncbi:unnamed protein product [Leptidea sinapis]|uniref:Rhabdovirus nucleocapsid domain-containing protein n=1 Tax=Leptidea sinapis TaxID=189913 RepID=A0A5E4QLR0_9NEOP|nr:unnamed protein product [Leptidea sinapis]
MTSLLSSFRREKGKEKKSKRTGKGTSDTYTSGWFAYNALKFLVDRNTPRKRKNTSHPGVKPVLSIETVCKGIEQARKALRKGIQDNDIDVDVAKTFLYFYAKKVKGKLDDDWMSYSLTIGIRVTEVTPLDIIQEDY